MTIRSPAHATTSFTSVLSFPQGLASTLGPASASTTLIYDHFTGPNPDSTLEVVPPLPSMLGSPISLDAPLAALSPTDSMLSHDSEQSVASLSFTNAEAAYGARIPSFVSLDVERSSEPPTPLDVCHVHVAL